METWPLIEPNETKGYSMYRIGFDEYEYSIVIYYNTINLKYYMENYFRCYLTEYFNNYYNEFVNSTKFSNPCMNSYPTIASNTYINSF